MGYIGNFVAICAFLPLPFAGYWLAYEIYAYSQTLGLTMMGGAFSWLFIIQAVLIGNLFLAANYYLWLGMGRIEGAQQFQRYIKYLLVVIALCFAVWATPRSIIATVSEVRAMGGSAAPGARLPRRDVGQEHRRQHPDPHHLRELPALPPHRQDRHRAVGEGGPTRRSSRSSLAAAAIVIFLGVYGYFVEASVRIGFSIPQVRSVLFAMVAVTAIDVFLFRKPKRTGETRWGRIPAISQYVLIFIAVTFTWLMGLMGYVRSGLRQHWHVYGVIRDTSLDAFTPTLGFATQVVSVTVLIFFVLIGFVFWLASLHAGPTTEPRRRPATTTAPARFRRSWPRKRQATIGGRRNGPAARQDRPARPRRHGFYTYVGQLVPQKEVQPPVEIAIRADMTTDEMVRSAARSWTARGSASPATRSASRGRCASPTSTASAAARRDPRAGPDRRRVPGAVDLRARQLHRRPASTPACR